MATRQTYKTRVLCAEEDGAIDAAVEHLIAGHLVAVPTETVYGLAADAHNATALELIYKVKGRPANNPLICHVADTQMAKRYVVVSDLAEKLMQKFWPGPLTFVLPISGTSEIPAAASANLDSLAVRCPANHTTRSVIKKLGRPIAAPSANPSGKLSPTSADDVLEGLNGDIPVVLDDGAAVVGIESTIISIQQKKITLLRPGAITADDISTAVGQPVFDRNNHEITAPGQLKSHYAPNAAVRLNATHKTDNETLIGFGAIAGDITLSSGGDLQEAAQALFATLRAADKAGCATIAVAPIPSTGIGIAINDRLKRAAAPRPT